MIGYIILGTNNFPQACEFYDQLLAEVGAKRVMEMDNFVAWAREAGKTPALCICKPFDEKPATVGNGAMVALAVDNKEKVDALYNKAISLGAIDEGGPGPRGGENSTFYAAYFRDIDGNKLNVYCMG